MSRSLLARIVGAAFAVLVVARPGTARAAVETIEAPEAGFRLTIPDVGWIHRNVRGDEGLRAIAVGPEAMGGLVQLSIQVSDVAESDVEAARAAVRELRGQIASVPGITEVEDLELTIAGRTAPGVQLVQAALGQVFRVHLVLLRAKGVQYRIQFHAPREDFDEHWETAGRVLDGFELIDLDDAGRERARLRALAARCGSLVDWAADWEEAAKRARGEARLIVVAVHALPGFDVGDALNEHVFMDPEVIALMEHRFVGLRWSAGTPAPCVDHQVFGLGGNTFGAGLLICTPAGGVIRQVFLLEPSLVADALRSALLEHPETAPPPTRVMWNRADHAVFLIDSGQLDAARTLLGEPEADEAPAVAFQRARLARIERRGPEALAALEAARRDHEDTDPTTAALLLEEASVQIGLGRNDAAAEMLARCLLSDPDDAQRAEATLRLGALEWAAGDPERARETWLALTRSLPEQPAAWIAAAGVIGPALDRGIEPDLSWPNEIVQRMAALPAAAPSATTIEIGRSLASAVDWLLATQRSDGGWDTPSGIRDTQPAPDPIAMATQAIATLALARAASAWGDDDAEGAARCRDASRRALDRYLADRELVRTHPRPVAFMDYTCWGSSYGLFCLTGVLDPALAPVMALDERSRGQVESEAAHLVDDLVMIQQANGGWSYYLSGEVDGQAVVAAMSFTTATVLLALDAARERGLDVPEAVLSSGSACLASMRGTNGVWEYLFMGAGPHAAGEVDPAGAAARGPVCTLAMLRLGRLDASAMQPAFETYVEHLGGFGAEARKALMHAGTAGQGSHYLLYDYSTAAEALRAADDGALDGDTRRRARGAILRELARCRSADGSFVDNPLLGTATGTGLAALTLLDLAQDPLATESTPVSVRVDPRVELMSIIFRLAGNREYNMPNSASPYADDVEAHFGAFRDHAAVRAARDLRGRRGVSYDAVMSMAVHLTDVATLGERVPFDAPPARLDSRWTAEDARRFLAAVRAFVRETEFERFVADHAAYYEAAAGRLRERMLERDYVAWFDRFFGARPGAVFYAIPGLLNGGGNYGCGIRFADGSEEITPIIGVWQFDAEGVPVFDTSILDTIAHEFCHSYTNPYVDAHAGALEAAGTAIFPHRAAIMQRQAYAGWRTMMYESLVRACTVRFMLAEEGPAAARACALDQQARGFTWTADLAALLGEYETDRDRYPTFESFMPRVVEFFDATAAGIVARAARAPKVVSTEPANGATDVDPDLDVITITFDRPMMDGIWSVGGGPSAPPIVGALSYDTDRLVLTIPVDLAPGCAYRFDLNGRGRTGFRSADGEPLKEVVVEFRTR